MYPDLSLRAADPLPSLQACTGRAPESISGVLKVQQGHPLVNMF